MNFYFFLLLAIINFFLDTVLGVLVGVGRANFFPDRSGPSQNFYSKFWTEPVRAKILLQKIRTEPKRAKKNLDRAGPSQNIAL